MEDTPNRPPETYWIKLIIGLLAIPTLVGIAGMIVSGAMFAPDWLTTLGVVLLSSLSFSLIISLLVLGIRDAVLNDRIPIWSSRANELRISSVTVIVQ